MTVAPGMAGRIDAAYVIVPSARGIVQPIPEFGARK